MQETTTKHWANFNEVSFVAGMRLLFWIYRWFGPWPFRIVLYPVLFWYVLTQKKGREASQNYLRQMNRHAKLTLSTNLFGVMRHFAAFAETILNKMLLWGGLFKVEDVEYYGQEALHRQIELKKGALLICSHIGNIDMCRVLSRRYPEIKLTILVHTKHAQSFNRMMGKLNPDSQLDLLQVTEMTPATAIMLAERVAQGGFVVIAGDRVPVSPNPRVTIVDFLGKPAAFPIGPYVLGSLLQCPVFLLFSLPIQGVPQVRFELLCESVNPKRSERERAFHVLASQYAQRLSYFCTRAPLQWFNFYDFWYSTDTRVTTSQLDISDASR
ncbi:acyltransferase [Undibacterium sp. LX40W]|uniref:Acyltransferase n=1 Tax=Undibacterium nitidum TaxID=2762298 RepID=A0A923KKL6_9BURK|nr:MULTISPECIES: acyltransferase [Undibacterium]MBC3880920.1 acyltransferase [Undibacterium nitidum]MBC3890347.1 acyltransferase [Undibacterium sp. LX40W]